MRFIKNNIHSRFTYFAVIGIITAFLLTGCNNEDSGKGGSNGEANISLSIRAASSSINEDKTFWEDRVDELRMILFDSETGAVAFNEKLYFPNGFDEKSRAVQMNPGTYDFYFIANETVYPGDFVSALANITNKSEFGTNAKFTSIKYNPDFIPDGTSQDGRFLMSAIYNDITIVSGGTESAPLPLPLPTNKVELIRALAKVEVIFRKKVSGSSIPQNTISSVSLNNVAANISLPPYDNYYTGDKETSNPATLTGFNYANDSIGAATFYIPEFLIADNGTGYTELNINNQTFAILSDQGKAGITEQRRTVPELSNNSVIRNYHYIINAYVKTSGGVEIRVYVEPWKKDKYKYLFEGGNQVVIPPVTPTDSSLIIQTDCGKIEIMAQNEYMSNGLQGAYNDVVNYYDPDLQGPTIYKGDPPYYCEKKYGEGWRLMNSCELMSFLATLDAAYNVWMCNTWDTDGYNRNHPESALPYYSVSLRKEAQALLEELTGLDLSASVYQDTNNWQDALPDKKLNIIDEFFTPGDIMLRPMDFTAATWPFPTMPTQENWFYYESAIQVKAFWYDAGYVDLSLRENWDKVLYGSYQRYDYGSTVCRCVREVD
ncbi:FimB/Mfa2 family fimbrial subunit [Dysgonomonas macrotermitis]|uniref:Uncharacterized protein n=1 Tax=Dysgonomonas macrotermitis TaxID=1346286 RepID=A0A1M4XBA7_9BACT|nr:FimB/Mfa2 family fimbrial subunit [Dysgonomonas macrotermitis]SHE90838.1 hypothetical protein SAMN05444362_102465 [Dysgonomonas macrotermitis]